jgi:hypothetical protein
MVSSPWRAARKAGRDEVACHQGCAAT